VEKGMAAEKKRNKNPNGQTKQWHKTRASRVQSKKPQEICVKPFGQNSQMGG